MQQLTGVDASFLSNGARTRSGHVGTVCLLDPSTAKEPLTLDRFTQAIEPRLFLLPNFKKRLVELPLSLEPAYFVDDDEFDIEFHVRELTLPRPGNDEQLAEQVSRLHARPLDRSRPLWEVYLVSGLSGDRIAIYSKVDHAVLEGSDRDLLTAVLDLSPERRELTPRRRSQSQSRSGTGGLGQLFKTAISVASQSLRVAQQTANVLRLAPSIVSAVARSVTRSVEEPAAEEVGRRAPRTPFNAAITQRRRWAFCSVPRTDVERIERAAQLSGDAVVRALTAGGLRRWLVEHESLPAAPLVAAVPADGLFARLPTQHADPKERLHALRGGAAVRPIPARLRTTDRINAFNLVLSTAAGPNVPLYLAGAELTGYYPVSAIADGHGLTIAVIRHRDRLYFGITACRELVPDADRLATYIRDELRVLKKAVRKPLEWVGGA